MSTDTVKNVRAAVKALGYNSRQVSVRKSTTGSVRVGIKSCGINRHRVEAAVNGFERVSYCERSGEILSGGNVFVTVSYACNGELNKTQTAVFRFIDSALRTVPNGGKITFHAIGRTITRDRFGVFHLVTNDDDAAYEFGAGKEYQHRGLHTSGSAYEAAYAASVRFCEVNSDAAERVAA